MADEVTVVPVFLMRSLRGHSEVRGISVLAVVVTKHGFDLKQLFLTSPGGETFRAWVKPRHDPLQTQLYGCDTVTSQSYHIAQAKEDTKKTKQK